jgi:hypothetical protein
VAQVKKPAGACHLLVALQRCVVGRPILPKSLAKQTLMRIALSPKNGIYPLCWQIDTGTPNIGRNLRSCNNDILPQGVSAKGIGILFAQRLFHWHASKGISFFNRNPGRTRIYDTA